MTYPTLEQVEKADMVQLARWYRFLPSPGTCAVGEDRFDLVLLDEAKVMERICERFKEGGGMTPELSKRIGW